MRFPSSPVRSKSIPGSGAGNVIGFEADPRDGVMLDARCFGGGITGIEGAFGGNGILPEGGLGIGGRAGADGECDRGILEIGCVFGSGKIPEMADAAAGGAGGAGGCGGGNGGSSMEASSMLMGSGSTGAGGGGAAGNQVSMSRSPSSAGCQGMVEISMSPGNTSSLVGCSSEESSVNPKKSKYEVVFHCSREILLCGSTGW